MHNEYKLIPSFITQRDIYGITGITSNIYTSVDTTGNTSGGTGFADGISDSTGVTSRINDGSLYCYE